MSIGIPCKNQEVDPLLVSCLQLTASSDLSHHSQEVLLAQFSLYVHKGGPLSSPIHSYYQHNFKVNSFIHYLTENNVTYR